MWAPIETHAVTAAPVAWAIREEMDDVPVTGCYGKLSLHLKLATR